MDIGILLQAVFELPRFEVEYKESGYASFGVKAKNSAYLANKFFHYQFAISVNELPHTISNFREWAS